MSKNYTNYSNYSKDLKEDASVDKLSYKTDKPAESYPPVFKKETLNVKDVSDIETSKKAVVICDKLNFRRTPETEGHNILYVLNKNESVDVLKELDNGFSEVTTKGVTGYVMTKFISVQ